jgi:hypothetical protein
MLPAAAANCFQRRAHALRRGGGSRWAAAPRSSSARAQRRRPHSGATAPPGITCGASCGARGLGTGGTLCGRVSKPPESTPARGKCGTVPSGTPHSSSTQPRRSCRKPHAFHVISARDMAQTARAARDSRPTRAVQRTPQPRHTPRFTPHVILLASLTLLTAASPAAPCAVQPHRRHAP